jgi:signal peptidase II
VRLRGAAVVALVVIALDQATKLVVDASMAIGDDIAIIPGFMSLVHVRNRGVAFGMLGGLPDPWRPLVLIALALAMVAVLAWMLRETPREEPAQRLALALVVGGAIGNLYDRIRYGEVIDFLDVYVSGWHWPAFNVADSAITVGCGLLIFSSLIPRRGE